MVSLQVRKEYFSQPPKTLTSVSKIIKDAYLHGCTCYARKSHGAVPHKIIEVSTAVVESFLGRIFDPEEADVTDDGLKVFHDPSFRILLVTQTIDPVLLQYKLGAEKANALLGDHNTVIRKYLAQYNGREVEHSGSGFIISFSSAVKAVSCAIAIQNNMPAERADTLGFKMGLNAGEPIESNNNLFGDTIQLAHYMCTIAKYLQVAMASSVKQLVSKDLVQKGKNEFLTLPLQDENLLLQLSHKLESNWQDPEFDIENYCQEMAMSK